MTDNPQTTKMSDAEYVLALIREGAPSACKETANHNNRLRAISSRLELDDSCRQTNVAMGRKLLHLKEALQTILSIRNTGMAAYKDRIKKLASVALEENK